MRKLFNYGLAVGALIAAGVLGASAGNATVIPPTVETFFFTSDHCTGGCLTGQANGGSVTVTDNHTGTLDFNVQLANGNQFINAGFDASFGFNLTGIPSVTYSGILPAGYTIPGENPAGSGVQAAASLHMDGTGFFQYGIEAPGNGGMGGGQGSSLVFTIAAAGLDIGDLSANSPQGEYFAADIISGTTGFTGGIDAHNGDAPSVPAPANTLGLLGIGLIGTAGAVSWRRRRQQLPLAA